jgi:uncharacterized protein YceK
MRHLVLLLVVGLAGCQSVMKFDPQGNVIELKGGKAMRAYVAMRQSQEREERYKALQAMATVPAVTPAGEATRAMLAQTILFQDSAGVEAASYHKAEAENNARPWSLAKTALWALPAWYLAFRDPSGNGEGISLSDGSSINVSASNSGSGGGGGVEGVPGAEQSRVMSIGIGGEMLNQTNFASGQISGPTEKLIQTKDSPGISPVLDDSGDGSGNEAGLLQ